MPPGTPHIVFTLETALCRGSVYFPSTAYDLTLASIVEEHLKGLSVTNTSEIALSAQLFRLWLYYERRWKEFEHLKPRPDWPGES